MHADDNQSSNISQNGSIVTIIADGQYYMGDSDNKIDSRNLALTQAKINASEIAGTYIESSLKISTMQENDHTKRLSSQEIHSFTAAILQSEIISEKIEFSSNQTMVYKVTIKAKIDISILHTRIKELSNDKEKKAELMKLENDNKMLMIALEKLNDQLKNLELSKNMTPSDVKTIRDQREYIVNKIIKNGDSAGFIVNGGALLNEFEAKKQYAKDILERFELAVFSNRSQFYKVSLVKQKIIEETDNSYIVEVSGKCEYDKEKLKNSIMSYFKEDEVDLRLDGGYLNMKNTDTVTRSIIAKEWRHNDKLVFKYKILGSGYRIDVCNHEIGGGNLYYCSYSFRESNRSFNFGGKFEIPKDRMSSNLEISTEWVIENKDY